MYDIDLTFFVNNDTLKRLTFFTMADMAMLFITLIVLIGIFYFKRSQRTEDYYKSYMPNLFFKLFFAFACSLFYILKVKGGDSIAYWDMGLSLNRLFWLEPDIFFNNLWYDYLDPRFVFKYSIKTTGYPPTWIMKEHEGFFTAKVFSFFTFFTGGSYLAITAIIAAIVASVNWKFYEVVKVIFPKQNKWLTISILFIPSVSFWCTGISKDTLVYIAILVVLTRSFQLIMGIEKNRFWNVLLIVFYTWILLNTRTVVLMTLIIPLLITFSSRLSIRYESYPFFKRLVQLTIGGLSIAIFFVGITQFGSNTSIDKYIEEAEITQKDFTNNAAYTGAKYSIEVTDYSPIGLISVLPQGIVAGWFRPFAWEALSVSLFLNGIESLLLLYFSFKFIRSWRKNIAFTRKHELLVLSFFFAVLLGFITGFSSIIFGVLIRLRAPLLPFLGMLLTANRTEDN